MKELTLQHLLDEAYELAAAQHPREGVILAVLAGLHRSGNKDALQTPVVDESDLP